MMPCFQENIIQMQTELTSKSYHTDIKSGSENVRHKHMYRGCVLYPSVYLDGISMGGISFQWAIDPCHVTENNVGVKLSKDPIFIKKILFSK